MSITARQRQVCCPMIPEVDKGNRSVMVMGWQPAVHDNAEIQYEARK